MGRLVIPNRKNNVIDPNSKYLYIATGTGLLPNINGLRFYDSGLTQSEQPIYYDETNTYQLRFAGTNWLISRIQIFDGYWARITRRKSPLGAYSVVEGFVGTVTISEYKSNISIKKQNFTNFIVSKGSILPPGIDPNGVYLLENSLINGKSWYIRSNQGISIRIVSSISSIWTMQYLLNNWLFLTSSTNPAANPWEATWPSNIQVSFSNGKISLYKAPPIL